MTTKRLLDFSRKTPVQRRTAGTLAALFEAVAQILDRGGLDKLTTNHVAERAGFSIGTLYSYFPNKQGLIRAMVLREFEKQEALLSRALQSTEATRVSDFARIVVRSALGTYDGRHRVRREVMLTVGADPTIVAAGSAVLDRVADIFVAVISAKALDVSPAISREARFVMLHAVAGAVRAATLANKEMLGSPEFEDELVRMLSAFCAVSAHEPNTLSAAELAAPER